VGVAYETGCAEPSSDSTGSGGIGHEIDGGVVVGVGPVVDPPHAAGASATHKTASEQQRRCGVILPD